MGQGRAKVIGLTGGIGSGKSTVAAELRALGAAVIDADELARRVVLPGQPALVELVTRFGAAILQPDGHLDRKRLGEHVFADDDARRALTAITHPRIAAASQEEIQRLGERGVRVVFYEAALLVENRATAWLDGLIVVAADAATQRRRVMARDGLSAAAADARIASQLPLVDKTKVATWVVDNDGDVSALAARVRALVPAIEERFGPIASTTPRAVALVTGFPTYTARRMIEKLLDDATAPHLVVLAQEKFADDARAMLASRDEATRARAEILVGDVCDMHLGLSSREYQGLCARVTEIHHLAGIYYLGVDEATTRRVNVGGTQAIVEVARDCAHLRRLVHWSTALVSGTHAGTMHERDLELGQRFHNAYERSKYEAERVVRQAMRDLPITVLRPGIIVGDSRTGEIGRFDGPYYLMVLFATNATGIRLPLPGRGNAPLHIVPIDYVLDAALHLARDERAGGRTFHLTDPAPLPMREVFDRVTTAANTLKPGASVPRLLARAAMLLPGVGAPGPRALLDMIDHDVRYDCASADELLRAAGITCPPVASYLPTLVKYILDSR